MLYALKLSLCPRFPSHFIYTYYVLTSFLCIDDKIDSRTNEKNGFFIKQNYSRGNKNAKMVEAKKNREKIWRNKSQNKTKKKREEEKTAHFALLSFCYWHCSSFLCHTSAMLHNINLQQLLPWHDIERGKNVEIRKEEADEDENISHIYDVIITKCRYCGCRFERYVNAKQEKNYAHTHTILLASFNTMVVHEFWIIKENMYCSDVLN